MSKAETKTPDALSVSPLQIERLRAGNISWQNAVQSAEEVKEKWSTARETRDERKLTLTEALEEDDADDHRVAGLASDFASAERKFVSLDRDKRSREDHARKMEAHFVKIAQDLASGEADDLYAQDLDASDTWRAVLLADVISDIQAIPFVRLGVNTIGDLLDREKAGELKKLAKAGDLTRQQIEFSLQSAAKWMSQTGRGRSIPASIRDLIDKTGRPVPEPVKVEVPKPAAESGEDGEDKGEPEADDEEKPQAKPEPEPPPNSKAPGSGRSARFQKGKKAEAETEAAPEHPTPELNNDPRSIMSLAKFGVAPPVLNALWKAGVMTVDRLTLHEDPSFTDAAYVWDSDGGGRRRAWMIAGVTEADEAKIAAALVKMAEK